jgi:hypothetical protein
LEVKAYEVIFLYLQFEVFLLLLQFYPQLSSALVRGTRNKSLLPIVRRWSKTHAAEIEAATNEGKKPLTFFASG